MREKRPAFAWPGTSRPALFLIDERSGRGPCAQGLGLSICKVTKPRSFGMGARGRAIDPVGSGPLLSQLHGQRFQGIAPASAFIMPFCGAAEEARPLKTHKGAL